MSVSYSKKTSLCGAHSTRAGRDEGGSPDVALAEISRRMYDEIRSSRDPREHVEDG